MSEPSDKGASTPTTKHKQAHADETKQKCFFLVFKTQTVVAQLSGKSSAMGTKNMKRERDRSQGKPQVVNSFVCFLPEIKPKRSHLSLGMSICLSHLSTIEDHFCLTVGFLEWALGNQNCFRLASRRRVESWHVQSRWLWSRVQKCLSLGKWGGLDAGELVRHVEVRIFAHISFNTKK